MYKINNKKIIFNLFYSLGILAILGIGIMIMPRDASAQNNGRVTRYNSTRFESVSSKNRFNTYEEPYAQFQTNVPAPTVYSNSVNPNAVNYTTALQPTVARTSATSATSARASSAPAQTADTETASDLAAGVIFGSENFLPSGLIQWIFFAILVLLIIILARKIFSAEKYHSTPMKHA